MERVEETLNIPVTVVGQDGFELIDAIFQRENSSGGEVCCLPPEDGDYYRYNPAR